MVFGFICHSLSGCPCRVLHCAIFGDDLQHHSAQVATLDSLRLSRKEQVLQLASRVQTEYGFRLATKDKSVRDDYSELSTDEFAEKGIFRLAAGDPFVTAKTVVWLAKEECAYALVCELDENCMQAEAILTAIAMLIAEHITSHEQKNAEVMLKAEKISIILNQFLPCGQLLFLNHKVKAQLERQVEKILTTK